MTGAELREVQFDVPKADPGCLRQIRGFEDFNSNVETLTMLKVIYGLKDAPRAWRKKLHQAFIQWMSCRQLYSEPELYCVHTSNHTEEVDTISGAVEHNDEQAESQAKPALHKFKHIKRARHNAYYQFMLMTLKAPRVAKQQSHHSNI